MALHSQASLGKEKETSMVTGISGSQQQQPPHPEQVSEGWEPSTDLADVTYTHWDQLDLSHYVAQAGL